MRKQTISVTKIKSDKEALIREWSKFFGSSPIE